MKFDIRYIDNKDYHINFYVTTKSNGVGYLDTIEDDVVGELSSIYPKDSTNTLPNNEPEYYPKQTITISGETNSDVTVSLKSYSVDTPYKLGKKIVDNQEYEITEVTDDYVVFNSSNINYKTFFNKNTYSYSKKYNEVSGSTIFEKSPMDSEYKFVIQTDTSFPNNTFDIYINSVFKKTMSFEKAKNTTTFYVDLLKDEVVELLFNTTMYNINFSMVASEEDDEKRYKTVYSIGKNTFDQSNTIKKPVIKNDYNRYDEKPRINNYMEFDRVNKPVFKNYYGIASLNHIEDVS